MTEPSLNYIPPCLPLGEHQVSCSACWYRQAFKGSFHLGFSRKERVSHKNTEQSKTSGSQSQLSPQALEITFQLLGSVHFIPLV